jgi:hypothetical protein
MVIVLSAHQPGDDPVGGRQRLVSRLTSRGAEHAQALDLGGDAHLQCIRDCLVRRRDCHDVRSYLTVGRQRGAGSGIIARGQRPGGLIQPKIEAIQLRSQPVGQGRRKHELFGHEAERIHGLARSAGRNAAHRQGCQDETDHQGWRETRAEGPSSGQRLRVLSCELLQDERSTAPHSPRQRWIVASGGRNPRDQRIS